ncbi:unnamed protein product [Orchesella dallaii]|uniref:Uncharacterized protein n=1 Tax=Orchesella dallaii TaxID=48710 RepID=A0ABP1QV71_9HEXA
MDFSSGKIALLQALTIMNDNGELTSKISSILNSVHEDRSRTVKLFCEVLALQQQEVDRKRKCADLLEEVAKWWQLLVSDREKLLVTISNLEMEKDHILKKLNHPNEIYGPLIEATSKSQLMNNRSNICSQPNSTHVGDDDFVEDNNK